MKRRNLVATAAIAALTALAGVQAQAQEKVVNVYNWSDYIDESILAEFRAEFAMPDVLIRLAAEADKVLCY